MSTSLPNERYTVGWVCALPIELSAAKAMLDEEHEGPQTPPKQADDNIYLLGAVGKFNVVITCLPKNEIGSSSAAAVAKDMLFTFPGIRFGLMVGIGAGIPDYELDEVQDVRLGDVVVSSSKENGGVVVYDFGRRLGDGSFQARYPLNQPPRSLRTALTRLETEHMLNESQVASFIEKALTKYPKLRKKGGWVRPNQDSDRLFHAEYPHVGGRTCAECDKDYEIDRQEWERHDTSPVIHYGTIATGSAVVKHAPTRTEIGKTHQAICLEMEAAGLMNAFPCLVIRGISDYADSHKNDTWHNYAAVAASACAKELLQFVTPKEVEAEDTAQKILNSVSEDVSSIKESVSVLNTAVVEEHQMAILDWLSPHNFNDVQNDRLAQRIDGTCLWFLETAEMKNWLQSAGQTLFCPGIPGAGKTVMAATIIEHLQSLTKQDPKSVVAYIYCSYQPKSEQAVQNMLQVLLRQVTAKQRSIPDNIKRLHKEHATAGSRPSVKQLLVVLCQCLRQYNRVFIVLDAVDEYYVSDYESHQTLLSELSDIQRDIPINLLMTSRFNNTNVSSKFPGSIQKEIRAHEADILLYLNRKLPIFVVSVAGKVYLEEHIQSMVLQAADGMFLLAQLHTEYLMKMPTIRHLKRSLEALPRGQDGLTPTYVRAMSDIDRQANEIRDLARKALSWLAHSKQALSSVELQHALVTESGQSDLDEELLLDIDILHNLCAGLIVWDRATDVVRLIHYTTHEFLQTEGILKDPESQVALNCLTYMSFEPFSFGRCSNPESYMDRHERYPLYMYCTKHWGDHARNSNSDDAKNVALQFLASIGCFSAACQSMKGPPIKRGKPLDSSNILKYSTCRITAAHVCAYFGLTEWLQILLQNGAEVNAKDSKGDTPLTYAARAGHESTVKLIGPEMSHGVISKDDALEEAAGEGHEADVRYLLSGSAGTEVGQEQKQRALKEAAGKGHVSIMKLLLDQGTNPEYNHIRGGWFREDSPLELAISSGNLEAVRLLLPKDGTISEYANKNMELVFRAVSDANYEMVQLLLNHGADPDLPNTSGRTPFIKAVFKGEKSTARLLLSKDIDVNAQDQTGGNPLIYSVRSGDEELVNALLMKGADPNLRAITWDLETPLDRAVSKGYLKIVQALILKGADPNQPSGSLEDPPLCSAAGNDHEEVVRYLLERGADVNLSNKVNETPLFFAIKARRIQISRLLLSEGAKLDSQNIVGNTALFYAVQCPSNSLAADLITRGSDPNQRNELEETPLFFAARAGSLSSVHLLLNGGAHADPRNKLRETPLLQAATFLCADKESCMEYAAIIELLIANGADPNPTPDLGYPHILFDAVGDGDLVSQWSESDPEKFQQVQESWSKSKRLSKDLFALFCEHISGRNGEGYSKWKNSCSARRSWKDGLVTPLVWSVRAGCTDLSQRLVDLGLDDMDAPSSEPLLYKAADFKHNKVADLIYKSDLRVYVQNIKPGERGTVGKLAFLSAVEMGNLAIISVLQRHSLSYLTSTTRVGDFALLVSSRCGRINLCHHLIDAGFDLHHRDETGKTSLTLASIEGHNDLVELLLQKGCQTEAEDNTGRTPLLWAVQLGNTPAVELLLRAGANPNCLEQNSRTPLLFSTLNGDDFMVELLLKYGANPNFANKAGESALSWAVAQNYEAIANMLLKREARLINENNLNQSSLFWLIRPFLTKRVKSSLTVRRSSYNLKQKAFNKNDIFSVVSTVQVDGKSDFDGDETVGNDMEAMLRLLISHGQNIDLKDENGRTCLARAAFAPNEDYARIFLRHGANPDTQNDLGETPLFLASLRRGGSSCTF
ncbi:hypothetical protein DTO046C5_6555 [Penicillium roqueforti]|nr:hypothetical protein DTO046C5_6555 [Penicillium roqueforti]